jgi:hypothetical protein
MGATSNYTGTGAAALVYPTSSQSSPVSCRPMTRDPPKDTPGNQIVFTKAYDPMFHRLLRLHMWGKKVAIGAVITGRPGTGAPP